MPRWRAVAARDRVALPRAHAEACQHALVVALEDALAAGRHADVLTAVAPGTTSEALVDAAAPAAPRTSSALGVVSDRSHDRDGVAGRAQAARMHGHVEADPAGALEIAVVPAIDAAIGRADDPHERVDVSAAI
jgi:hypothetical protein